MFKPASKTQKVAFYIGRNNVTLINSEGLSVDQIGQVNEDYLINPNYVKDAKKNDFYLTEYEVTKDGHGRWGFQLIDSKTWGDLRLDTKNYG